MSASFSNMSLDDSSFIRDEMFFADAEWNMEFSGDVNIQNNEAEWFRFIDNNFDNPQGNEE